MSRGRQAEDAALAFLTAAGLRLVSRNYRCRVGEIDLVMEDGGHLVFVEVRARSRERWGTPEETVTFRKQARLAAAARHFILAHPTRADRPMRFDVVAISPGSKDNIRWIRAAFDAPAG
ncbi:MAG: YraN family protein [Gammaproteobacteria bacterium]